MRLRKKKIAVRLKHIGKGFKVPGALAGVILVLIILLPFVIAALLSLGSGILGLGNGWGSGWGMDFLMGGENKGRQDIIGSGRKVTVILYREALGEIVTLDLEDYVAGVVAGEMPSAFPEEALKAQAVAARTYAMSKITRGEKNGNAAQHPDAPLCDTTHCQVYRSESELSELKSQDWMETEWPKVKAAVAATSGQVMYYQGALVEQPLFHSASGGRTENSEDVFVSALPYLRSVDSSQYEGEAPHQNESVTYTFSQFCQKVQNSYGATGVTKDTVKVLSRTEGGGAASVQVGSKYLTGRQIRELLGLRSTNFTISFSGDDIVFTTSGYGHGVGMSQWGASGMAKEGYTYDQILTYYYSGVEIGAV